MRRRRGTARRRRAALLATVLAVATATAVAAHLGWFSPARAWREATGWSAIPDEERVGFAPAWPEDAGEAPELSWLGHGGFAIRWHGRLVLFDPNLSDRCTIAPRRMLRPVAPEQLGEVDAVLISHAHLDHLDGATLGALRRVGTLVVPRGSEGFVRGLRRDAEVVGLLPDERLRLGELEVVAVPAAHHGNRYHPLASRFRASGYVLRAAGTAMYLAGDTGRRNDFESIARAYRPRLAVLPIGAFSPSFPLRRYHLSPEDAVDVARRLGVAEVVPSHFGTFVLSLDAPADALPRFARAARRAGVRWSMPRMAGAVDAEPVP